MRTLFLAWVLGPCFWERNLKTPLREAIGTRRGLAEEVRRGLVPQEQAPGDTQRTRGPCAGESPRS